MRAYIQVWEHQIFENKFSKFNFPLCGIYNICRNAHMDGLQIELEAYTDATQ